MALGDYAIDVNDLTEAQMRFYKARPAKAQYTRLGETSRWFNPRKEVFRGQSYEWFCITAPATPTRREKIVTASGQEFPSPRAYDQKKVSALFSDLTMFQGSVEYNEIEELRSKDKKTCIAELAMRSVNEAEMDAAEQLNFSLHQPRTCAIGTIGQIYDIDGSTMSGTSADDPAYISLVGGSVAQVHKGDILEIIDGGDKSTRHMYVKVWDVIYGLDGPAYDNSGSPAKVSGIGPGLIVEPCAETGSTTVGTGYNTAYTNVAAGDIIARSGEYTSTAANYRNLIGLPSWFDPTVDVYRNADGGALLDRMAAGNSWMQPEVFDYSSGGNPVTFDVDTHLADAEIVIPTRVRTGRKTRGSLFQGARLGSVEDGASLPDSLVMIGEPALLQNAVREARDDIRFTTTAKMNMTEAENARMFGVTGFSGFVFQSPTLGSLAVQADPACQPNQLMVVDPQSFFYLTFGSPDGSVQWLDMGKGARFQRKYGGTKGTPTFYVHGGYWAAMALYCDQVACNFQIKGIKGS